MNTRDEFAFKALSYIRGNTYALKTITTQEELDAAVEDFTASARGAYLIADVMLDVKEKRTK